MKLKLIAIMAAFYLPGVMATTVNYDGTVNSIRIIHWAEDRACIKVGINWFLLDLTTKRGEATLSLAQQALSTQQGVRVSWNDANPLEGGCDMGTTMHPIHAFVLNR